MLGHWLLFAGVLVASGLLLAGILVVLMARTLLHPARMTDAKATYVLQRLSPGDLQLPFEPLRFRIRDDQTGQPMEIAAWWIPRRAATRTVLLIHGYADAKVGAIAWAPTLHRLGWNLLAIDLRAHGESDGTLSTAGYWERHDVTQVINQIRATRPGEMQTLAIFGISLGAAVAVATAAMRDDIAGIILESPFADYRKAVAAHGRLRGLPGGILRDVAIRLAEWMAGADFRAVRPGRLIRDIKCPLMVIHSGNDPFVPSEDALEMAGACGERCNGRDVVWSIPGAGHVLGLAAVGAEAYRQRIGQFLEAIAPAPQALPVSE